MKKIKRIIFRGRHYPHPSIGTFIPMILKKNRYYVRNKSIRFVKSFLFTDSTMYDFKNDDQHDVNKLFGFSIGWHHKNSFRFGWRPNKDLTKMEIVGYEYHDGVRTPTIPICEVELNKWYYYQIRYIPGFSALQYCVCDEKNKIVGIAQSQIRLKHKYNWGYTLGVYFGGNRRAPHTMTIYQKI